MEVTQSYPITVPQLSTMIPNPNPRSQPIEHRWRSHSPTLGKRIQLEPTPSYKYELVSWDYELPNIWKNIQTTNQMATNWGSVWYLQITLFVELCYRIDLGDNPFPCYEPTAPRNQDVLFVGIYTSHHIMGGWDYHIRLKLKLRIFNVPLVKSTSRTESVLQTLLKVD